MLNQDLKTKIESLINDNKVFLFMKGYKDQPMCGFSAQVIHILNQAGVEYETFNILDDYEMREGIKEFANWPTIPQLYINGKFIGGCDITMQLARSGELNDLLKG